MEDRRDMLVDMDEFIDEFIDAFDGDIWLCGAESLIDASSNNLNVYDGSDASVAICVVFSLWRSSVF